ncbi:hypothetical protein ABSA28_01004 [Candidatus Hepatincolaceae symbiont of Richtersius coronifer]
MNLKQIITNDRAKKLIYTLLLNIMFLLIFIYIYSSKIGSLSGLLLIVFIYLPLFLGGLMAGSLGFILPVLAGGALYFLDPMLGILFFALFMIPAYICVLMTRKLPYLRAGDVLSFISCYSALAIGVIISYLSYQDKLFYSTLYDTLCFMMIALNSVDSKLAQSMDIQQQLQSIAIFFPSLIAIFWILWIVLNYRLGLIITRRMGTFYNSNLINNYRLPQAHTLLFILTAISTVLIHKLLDNQSNIYYTGYNIVFVLWFVYFYSGISFVWALISRTNKLIIIGFIAVLILLFLETFIAICLVGFLVEIGALKNKNLQKSK